MNEKNKGITLIALIVTIIVLLVLAGIGISMIVGDNGILTKALLAKNSTAIAEDKENQDFNTSNQLIDKYTTASRGAETSNLISDVTFSVIEKKGYSIKIQISVNSTNSDDARIYYVFKDGEVVNGGTSNIITINSLKLNTEYSIQCAVIDKQGKIKASLSQTVKTENYEMLYTGTSFSNIVSGFNPFRVDSAPGYAAYYQGSSGYVLAALAANRKVWSKY